MPNTLDFEDAYFTQAKAEESEIATAAAPSPPDIGPARLGGARRSAALAALAHAALHQVALLDDVHHRPEDELHPCSWCRSPSSP